MKIKIPWLEILIISLFLLSVYLILTRIFGHSATDLVISTSLFTFLGGLIYYILDHLIKLNREFGEFKIKTINSFDRLKDDINKIKGKLRIE